MNAVDYEPLLFERLTLDDLRGQAYRRFIFDAAIIPGIRLLLSRRDRNGEWPYPDTKFNPNTGLDLEPIAYSRVYSWMIGRGLEALNEHLNILDDLELPERNTAESVFKLWTAAQSEAIEQMAANNVNRCPFVVDRQLRPLDSDFRPTAIAPHRAGAGDVFCAKGLLSCPSAASRRRGLEMLLAAAEKVRDGHYGSEQFPTTPAVLQQGMKMLFLGAPRLVADLEGDDGEELKQQVFAVAVEFLRFVIDHHYDERSGLFSEGIDPLSRVHSGLLDPGHCTEFIGLGLSTMDAIERAMASVPKEWSRCFAAARAALPRMLQTAFHLGYNPQQGGMCKEVNTATGEILNPDMPWWNLPETMRAAARLLPFAGPATDDCLEVFRLCHNAYFSHYLNRDMLLFPFQTRCGVTGAVKDVAPAVPEGDPLYHSNLSFLDILKALEETLEC